MRLLVDGLPGMGIAYETEHGENGAPAAALGSSSPFSLDDHCATGMAVTWLTLLSDLSHRAGSGARPVTRRKGAALAAVGVAGGVVLGAFLLRDPGPRAPDVLLVTVDTLRADALQPYGSRDSQTPRLAQLADQGIVYEAATTPMPLTRPAVASILTGLYPHQHGVENNWNRLPEERETLAEMLRARGYQTAGFTAVRGLLGPEAGIAQGFETFRAPPKGPTEIRADRVVRRALRWVKGADRRRPVFLWVHLFDPHQPYAPGPRHRRGLDAALAQRMRSCGGRPSMPWRKRTTAISPPRCSSMPARSIGARSSRSTTGSVRCWMASARPATSSAR